MKALLSVELYSLLSLVGWLWSVVATWLMFSKTGQGIASRPWTIFVFAAALFVSLRLVIGEMTLLAQVSGGITPLDGQFGYDEQAAREFAVALGVAGRQAYAVFQLGADTLAPPAFACFLVSVYRSTVRSQWVLKLLTVIVATYFFSVLAANLLMPVIMLNFPDDSSGVLPALYMVVPKLDLIKYLAHGTAWLVIFCAWLWQLGALAKRHASPQLFAQADGEAK